MTESILLSRLQDKILWLTMNQPENLNSLGFDLVAALRKAFDEAAKNDEVRVVVLTGEGRGFCAGADLKTMTRQYAPGEPEYWIASWNCLMSYVVFTNR